MIIKHDRHIFREVHEACKDLWTFFLLCLRDADWQTLITWFEVCPYYSAILSPKIPQPIVRKIHVQYMYIM